MRPLSAIIKAYQDDQETIMKISLDALRKVSRPLFAIFVILNLLDVLTTAIAMRLPTFVELNPLTHQLFATGAVGFIAALIMKGLPTLTLGYMVFVSDPRERYPVQIRIIKVGALVALLGADLLYFYIVGLNNLPQLLRVFV